MPGSGRINKMGSSNAYRPEVLILDDFGLKPCGRRAGEDLYEVIDGRYQRASTILTTNRAFSERPELFDQPILASAATDRLAHGVTQVTITGDSYRAKGPRAKAAGATSQRKKEKAQG